ncbi:RNA polymerase sigma factor [Peristeroidobacter soli]|uniref:RNA polymerase sigma factor n=1 Tax=Peristeroidobacter soli TaxID=2497877 RepID=UPI00101BAB66|nr:RNA polymerase sigma factor [Peristeroidobacter soli]
MDLPSTPGPQPMSAAAGEVTGAVGAAVSTIGSAPDDATLMLRYRKGDVRAFEILYERHKGALYRYLNRLCRSPEVANDLFQEVWSKVIASRERYEARARFTTFLFHIAHNCAIDYFRRAGRPQEKGAQDVDAMADELSGPSHESPDAALAEAQLRADFKRALDELPAEQRDVFLLYEETGLGLEDIGRITGVAMETAKSRLRYALAKLRGALRQHQSPTLQSSVS